MKALLVVFVFYAGNASNTVVTPMPTMEGCWAAAQELSGRVVEDGGRAFKYVVARCVANR